MARFLTQFFRGLAWVGGALLVAITLLTVASITGRAFSRFGLGPVPGDFELVEAGTALAVFCFLPWCHLRQGHAAVDLFWPHFPAPLQRALSVLWDAAMLGFWILLTWRLGVATLDYRGNGEVSFILQMPVWWGYAASWVAAALGLVAYAWQLLHRLGLVAGPQFDGTPSPLPEH